MFPVTWRKGKSWSEFRRTMPQMMKICPMRMLTWHIFRSGPVPTTTIFIECKYIFTFWDRRKRNKKNIVLLYLQVWVNIKVDGSLLVDFYDVIYKTYSPFFMQVDIVLEPSIFYFFIFWCNIIRQYMDKKDWQLLII